MPRKLFSADVEKRLLKTLLNTKHGATLFSRVAPDHFVSETMSIAYQRVLTLMKKRGVLISWRSLSEDHGLPENVRLAIAAYKKKPAASLAEAKILMDASESYRRLRAVNDFGKKLHDMLNDESVDSEDLIKAVSSGVGDFISKRGIEAYHIGSGDNSASMVRSMLRGSKKRYIPTGFDAYDEVNRGFIEGSLIMVAAPSGNGKSAMVQTLARNLAMNGARVCFVPLEMDAESLMQRELAHQMALPLTRFLDPQLSMSARERNAAFKSYKKLSKKIRGNGGKLTIFGSEDDLSIEGILSYCKVNKYKIVVIDYVGLLSGTDGDDQARALSKITKASKRWATANKAVVILAAQLSDDGLVRYSRAMKEDASNLWQWTLDDKARETGIIRIMQPKSRMQDPTPFSLHFDPPTMTIRDLTEREKKESVSRVQSKGRSSKSKGYSKSSKRNKSYDDIDVDEYMNL